MARINNHMQQMRCSRCGKPLCLGVRTMITCSGCTKEIYRLRNEWHGRRRDHNPPVFSANGKIPAPSEEAWLALNGGPTKCDTRHLLGPDYSMDTPIFNGGGRKAQHR
jgi:hypothetical protein